MCGDLRPEHAGQQVVLMGWVSRRRDLGNLIFIDLRDRTGIAQLVFDKSDDPAIHEKAEGLRSEYVTARCAIETRRPSIRTSPPARSNSQ